ncbi:hypothetical protein BDF14DRAFT_1791670 [Spinellus fusiger]|nr:hypothetical protein BDF14DRAFT_1791670 [Spinellus fusiger]
MTKSKTSSSKQTEHHESIRRSLRSKTVPQLFLHQTQQAIAASRRQEMSDNENDELDSDTESDSDHSSSSDSEPAPSNKRKQQQQQQQQQKKKQIRGRKPMVAKVALSTASQLLSQIAEEEDQGTSLYSRVTNQNVDVDDIVSLWVAQYGAQQEEALRELVNFIIRSCGCMMEVTADAFKGEEIAVNAMQELQAELVKLPNHDYPISSKSKGFKVLKENLLEFFQTLIDQSQHEIIYDGTLIETLQNWLTTMSSSVYRPFRHTATLIAFKITSALSAIAEKVSDEFNIASRQLKTETRKADRAKNATKLKQLRQRADRLEKRRKHLEEYLHDFFESVFVHRSRDVESVIRNEALKELCVWMQLCPSYFVDNKYLRYFGWALNDLQASVRIEALKSIAKLYKIEENVSKLHSFIGRFKARIEEMALYDVDKSVSVQAIGLCSDLHIHNYELLGDQEQNQLADLILTLNGRVRKSVAPFVKHFIKNSLVEPAVAQINASSHPMAIDASHEGGRRGRAQKAPAQPITVNKTWVTFKCLAAFFLDHSERLRQETEARDKKEEPSDDIFCGFYSCLFLAVGTLWEHIPELRDYKSMSDYLCHDHSSAQQSKGTSTTTAVAIEDCYRLTYEEETVLLSIFLNCIGIGIKNGFEKSQIKEKKKENEDEFLEEVRNEVSRHLVHVLPTLFIMYSDSYPRMNLLTSIPPLMNMSVYVELRMTKEYEELLHHLVKVFLGTTEEELLGRCRNVFSYISEATYLDDINKVVLADLQEKVVGQVRDACRGKDLDTAKLDEEDIHAITVSMLRLDKLSEFLDVSDALDETKDLDIDVFGLVGLIAERSVYSYIKEKKMYLSSMAILFRYVAWQAEIIMGDPLLEGPGKKAAEKLSKRSDTVQQKFYDIVISNGTIPLFEVQCVAFGTLVDIYWLFSSELFTFESNVDKLAELFFECTPNSQVQCIKFIKHEILSRKSVMKTIRETEQTEESLAEDDAYKRNFVLLMTRFVRGLLHQIFASVYGAVLTRHYGLLGPEIDELIKTLIDVTATHILDPQSVNLVIMHHLKGIQRSFELALDEPHSLPSIDNPMKLARLQRDAMSVTDDKTTLKSVPPQALCDGLHLKGIDYALKKIVEYKEADNEPAMVHFIRFFKILSVFGKLLTRNSDIAKVLKHLEDGIQSHGLADYVGEKNWDAYNGYVKMLGDMLKKNGFRYDSSKLTEVATPRNDTTMQDDIDEEEDALLASTLGAKRTIGQLQGMDIDAVATTSKKRH